MSRPANTDIKTIAVISLYYPPETGAAASRVAKMVSGLRDRGFDVHVITSLPNYPTGKIFPAYRGRFSVSELIDGIPVKGLWMYSSNSRNALKRILNMVSFSIMLLLALPFLIRLRPGAIIVNSPPLPVGATGVILAKLLRIPVIANVSDIWPLSALELGAIQKGRFYSLLEKVERFLYRRSDAIVTQSQETLNHVLEQIPDRKTLLYRNLDAITEFIDQYPPIDKTPVKLVYAGLLGVAQGVFEICTQTDFQDLGVDLHIYGDGPDKTKIERFIQENPDCRIYLHEFVTKNDMPRVLSEYHATIIPLKTHIHGAFPSKIYMAMAASLPVIFSGSGEGASFVRDAKIGWVSGPSDFTGLAEQIAKLTTLPESEYRALREHIKWLATSAFSLNEQLDTLANFVRKIAV